MEDKKQPFDYYIVLDFEAAWTEQGGPKSAEIIEFPSYVLYYIRFMLFSDRNPLSRPPKTFVVLPQRRGLEFAPYFF
jgi:hypothetical protein